MGGKVLVPAQEHCDRLVAARLQADVMGTSTLIIARTDAEAATFLSSNVDARDHAFILGATADLGTTLNSVISEARAAGMATAEADAKGEEWTNEAQLTTYPAVVRRALEQRRLSGDGVQRMHKFGSMGLEEVDRSRDVWDSFVTSNPSLSSMQAKAAALLGGEEHLPFFDWEAPRAREGYYRLDNGIDLAIARAKAYAPYAVSRLAPTLPTRSCLPWRRPRAQVMHSTHICFSALASGPHLDGDGETYSRTGR